MPANENLARRARKFVFDHFREHATPPVLEQFMEIFGLPRDKASEVLHELEASRHLALVRGTDRILMAFPFSAIATPFRVRTHGRKTYFANCAWDAIAFHAMLGEDLRVDSYCHHCATPVSVELRKGQVTLERPRGVVVYLGLPASRWWDDITTTCSNTMVFFASAEHHAEWASRRPTDRGELLTPDQIHRLGLPIYRTKMNLEYARPSKQELVAHFTAMGLAGDFWKL